MQNLETLEKAARDNDVQIVRELNTQLAGLDAERDEKISDVRAQYVDRRKALKSKRTEWLRRIKKHLSKVEYEQLAKASENGPVRVRTGTGGGS